MNIQLVKSEIAGLHTWVADRDHKYPAINTVPEGRVVDWLRSRSWIFGVAWRQFFRISPIDLRRAFGLKTPRTDSKATILFALAYLELSYAGEQAYAPHWQELLRSVLALRSGKVRHFGVRQNNVLYLKSYRAGEEDVSALLTAWAGRLFLRAFRYTGDSRYRGYACGVARYFLEEHPRDERPEGIYFYYDPNMAGTVFNASAEISSYLIEYGTISGDRRACELGRGGLQYLVAHQNEDGSWFYGAEPKFRYIDNFHTAFVLSAIVSAVNYLQSATLSESLKRGMRYFTTNLFRDSPAGLRPIHLDPRFRPFNSNMIQRVDLRDVTASVVLFLELAKADRRYREDADRVLSWALTNMRCASGTYYPEITILWNNQIPYIEFQAWMLYCLARYRNLTAD